MKKTMLVLAIAAVLMLWLSGCGDNDSPFVTIDPPTGLTVTSESENIVNDGSVTIEVEESREFTASAQGAANYTWTVIEGDSYVELDGDAAATATITAGDTAGQAKVRVTAGNSGGSISLEFNISINDSRTVWVTGVGEGTTVFISADETQGREFTAQTNFPGTITWEWTTSSAAVASLTNADTQTVTVIPESDGTAAIEVTADNGAGQSGSFSFSVMVGDPIPIRFRERGPAAHQIDRPDINPDAQWEGAVEVSVPSVGSAREFNGRIDSIEGVTYLWESSNPSVAEVYQITTPGFVTNQDTFVIVTAVGEGSAQITLTVTAPSGQVGTRSLTFTVEDAVYNPNWHPYASRLITNLIVRDARTNQTSDANWSVPANIADFFPHKELNPRDTAGIFLRDFWFIRPDIREGRQTFMDRAWTFSNGTYPVIPSELVGSDWIRGPHGRRDGGEGTERADHMEFRALVNIDVYLVYDSRAESHSAINWYLDSSDWAFQSGMYVLSGESIGSNIPPGTAPTTTGGIMHIRKRSYDAGQQVGPLGGARSSTWNPHFYIIKER